MSVFNGILDIAVAPKNESSSESVELGKLLLSIEELNLSARSFNCLDRAEVKYIAELALMSELELKNLKNLAKKSLEEISQVMEESGYPVGYNFAPETASLLKKKIEDLKSSINNQEQNNDLKSEINILKYLFLSKLN